MVAAVKSVAVELRARGSIFCVPALGGCMFIH